MFLEASMSQNKPSLLQCQRLACQRGDQIILSDFNLNLCAGELLQIVGENGSGKTTLLRTLAGLLPKTCGTIKSNAKLFYLAHDNAIKKELTVFENVRWDINFADASLSAIDSALGYFDLIHLKNRLANRLSQGQRRRIALAKCYLSSATLYILDEPLAALDTEAQQKVKQLLEKKMSLHACVIMTSHQGLNDFKITKMIAL